MELQVKLRMEKAIELLADKEEPIVNIGPGLMPLEYNILGRETVTVDVTKRFFHIWEHRERVVATVEHLPFRDDSVPTIMAMSVFQDLHNKCVQEKFIHEVSRVLVHEGFWLITVEYGSNYDGVREQIFPEELASRAEEAGLTVSDVRWLAYSGEWVQTREEGFSLWVMGST